MSVIVLRFLFLSFFDRCRISVCCKVNSTGTRKEDNYAKKKDRNRIPKQFSFHLMLVRQRGFLSLENSITGIPTQIRCKEMKTKHGQRQKFFLREILNINIGLMANGCMTLKIYGFA